MRFLILLILAFSVSAQAETKKSTEAKERIRKACVDRADKKVPDANRVCECIAKTHVESAEKKPLLKNAEQQLEWLVKFYGEKNPKKAQALVDKNHDLAAFDNLVAEDCMAPEGGAYASPIESK